MHGNIFKYLVGSTQTGKIKHPAMFPLNLVIDQINTWSNKDDLIYDPFMGSGTTAIGALETNRNFIGSEISIEYCELSNKRIKEYTNNPKIF